MTTHNPEADERDHRTVSVRSRFFAVRVWKEEVAVGSEYRGSVRDTTSGAFCSFRDWSKLAAFMIGQMEEDESAQPARAKGEHDV
jgi:hypothetical protein